MACVSAMRDPVLDLFLQRVRGTYGESVDTAVLIGERARGLFQRNTPYEIIVFFKKLNELRDKLGKLEVIQQDMLENLDAEFRLYPFDIASYNEKNGLMKSIRTVGVAYDWEDTVEPEENDGLAMLAQHVSESPIFCINIKTEPFEGAFYPVEFAAVNLRTGESKAWEFPLPIDWPKQEGRKHLNVMDFQVRDEMDDEIDSDVEPVVKVESQIDVNAKALSEFIAGATVLSCAVDEDMGCIRTIRDSVSRRRIAPFVMDYHKKLWGLAEAVGGLPEARICRAEIAARNNVSAQDSVMYEAQLRAEVMRRVAGIAQDVGGKYVVC